jgi:type I restriction enzyme S subunit
MKKYDSYKDSGVEWIGKIPTNWKSKRFSYSIDIQKGKIPKNLTDEKLIDSLPYLSMGVLRGDKPMEFSNENGIVHVSKGDIGLLWDGSNSGEVIRINREGILSSTVSLLSLKDDSIDKEFCFYLLKFYENDFRENTIGMGIPHVSGDHVRESKLIIPPISEQQQIVYFLDTKTSLIDSLIEKTQQKIELLKEKRTSLINEVVTKGLNPNVEMKDSGVKWIGEIPSHWMRNKLNRISERIGDGLHSTPKYVDSSEYYFINGNNLVNGEIKIFDSTKCVSEEEFKKYFIQLNSKTLLLSINGTIGNLSFYNDEKVILGKSSCYINLKENINHHFVYYVLKSESISKYFTFELTGTTIFNLSLNSIRNTPIVIPPENEQQQIVEYLDEQTELIDKTITIEEKRIELLKEYRQSLISEVVTGKRKVVE